MSKLAEASVEFARAHIEAFYDSDSFPKRDEFRVLWDMWAMVKGYLLQKDVKELVLEGTRCLPTRKARGGYRMVHQLEPLSAITYTALAHMVAEAVEADRKGTDVVFSYRIKLSSSKFFEESNYKGFLAKCRELSTRYAYVFKTDISDFYNRIYLHRVQNNIATASRQLEGTASALESFLMTINAKTSSGIPVGPAASIVVAEAVLLDVDKFLERKGHSWVRYVDDICVFSDSATSLAVLQEQLVQYLYDNHRLSLSQAKTSLRKADKLLDTLSAPEDHGGKTLLELARAVLDYGDAYTESDIDDLVEKYLLAIPEPEEGAARPDEGKFAAFMRRWEANEMKERREIRDSVLLQVFNESITGDGLDLGLARFALRKARNVKSAALLGVVLEKMNDLRSAIPEVFLYLKDITTPELLGEHVDALREAVQGETFESSRFARLWLFWYLSSHKALIEDPVLGKKLWAEADIDWQMQAARVTGDVARIKEQKAGAANLGLWDRRSLLMSSVLLPRAEREPWLRSIGARDFVETVIMEWAKKQ